MAKSESTATCVVSAEDYAKHWTKGEEHEPHKPDPDDPVGRGSYTGIDRRSMAVDRRFKGAGGRRKTDRRFV